MDKKNTIKVYTTSSGAELNISAPSTKQVISATNNRAQYFAEQAKKYRDEAKTHRDNAKYYAEQNSDVTFEYIDKIRASLEDKISTKQNVGDYALKKELPKNVSELINDAEYVNKTELDKVRLPSQEGCAGRVLMSDGENESWVGISTYQLFDTVLKDHILTYEESMGWALQGTYVYKEAVAGSRYGYPDFYNKCVEEYNEATEVFAADWMQPILTANGALGGNSFAVSSNITQYGTNDVYRAFDGVTASGVECFHSTQNVTTGYIDIYNPTALNITNFKIYNQNDANRASSAGIIYGSDNGLDWTQIKTYTNSVQAGGATWNIDLSSNINYYKYYRLESTAGGGNAFWTINEIQITATELIGKKHSNGHQFYNIEHKALIDEIYNSTGMAWYYGIDTENERVFLPRNNWFEQASTSDVGQSVEAGLPNITGTATLHERAQNDGPTGTGAFTTEIHTLGYCGYSGGNGYGTAITLNASRSSSVYGNSNTVQPNAVKKLLYICVGNTEVESVITDVVDVTTTENDTIPLGHSTYQNGLQPSVSWLKSEGQWNDGNIYTTFYNYFAQKIGETFAGGYIKEVTETYDDYDLVINQDDMTFRLPLLNGSEDIVDYENMINIATPWVSGVLYKAPKNGLFQVTVAATAAGQYLDFKINNTVIKNRLSTAVSEILCELFEVNKNESLTLETNFGGQKFSLCFYPYKGNGSLYFKVANAVENLELLDAGEVLNSLTGIVPNNSSLITNYLMPDYETKVVTTTSGYVCPYNCFIVIQAAHGNYNKDSGMYINGIHITNIRDQIYNTTTSADLTAQFYASKGDVITWEDAATLVSFKLKGDI